MSSKSSIILTNDNEHWYKDCFDYLISQSGKDYSAITMEFDRKNAEIVENESDEDYFTIRIKNPDSELYKIISNIKQD